MGFFRRIAGILGISRDDADHPDSLSSSSAAAAEFPQDRAAGGRGCGRGGPRDEAGVQRPGPRPRRAAGARARSGALPPGGRRRAVICMSWFYFLSVVSFDLVSHYNMLYAPCLFIQGFRWYTRKLRMDEDGDVADEFLDEVILESSMINNAASPVGRFQVKYTTKPASLALRKQIVAVDGDILHSLEHQGQQRWV
ncbi:hypothetical protein BAE44_0007603 [Dichanthelium oligosanthes]|uniref:Uncharacterized protein n=1 Tax=Dichanthelium oligosanthes TaxID=888268 RepID=A0A1E5W221_9POAL|nr:hypothetical protein BAE44_0007603 [Dichanthelium oligosanthes]